MISSFSSADMTAKSDNREFDIVERRKFLIGPMAVNDRSASAEVTGIVTQICIAFPRRAFYKGIFFGPGIFFLTV